MILNVFFLFHPTYPYNMHQQFYHYQQFCHFYVKIGMFPHHQLLSGVEVGMVRSHLTGGQARCDVILNHSVGSSDHLSDNHFLVVIDV